MNKKVINQELIREWAGQRARPIEELALRSGCSITLSRQIICGRYPKGKHPTPIYQQKIAEIIGCDPSSLFQVRPT